LIEILDDEPADEGVEEAWAKEVERRMGDIRSGRVEIIPGELVRERLKARLRNGRG
jgi:putative addiction module component (TIGR02574 family)